MNSIGIGKIKVVIAGAGISGLVVAHQLLKLPWYDVHVYEATNHIGGMARSSRDQNGCATEYSWRIYFWFYKNLFQILKEIPLIGQPYQSVFHNLSTKGASDFFVRRKYETTTLLDELKFGVKVLDFSTSCDQRARELDELSWREYASTNNRNDSTDQTTNEKPWETTPQVLGLDKFKASPYSVMKIGMENLILKRGAINYAMSEPTSEAWFDHWLEFLKKQGVQFHFGNELIGLNGNTSVVNQMVFHDKQSQRHRKVVRCDYCVLNLPVEKLAILKLENPLLLRNEPQLRHVSELAEKGRILQLCFQVHFNRPIFLANPGTSRSSGFILLGSPWSLIIETREVLFTGPKVHLCNRLPQVKGSWSVLAGQDGVPGILFHKPFSRCTELEIHQELWAQMMDNDDFLTAVQKYNGFEMSSRFVVTWSPMWSSFYYDGKGQLTTSEPKFSNNSGTLKLRPSCVLDNFNNLFLAGAFTKEAIDIFSMEGATISGRTVAKAITSRQELGPLSPYQRPLPLLAPFRWLDSLSYQANLPNLGVYLLCAIFIILCLMSVWLIAKAFKTINGSASKDNGSKNFQIEDDDRTVQGFIGNNQTLDSTAVNSNSLFDCSCDNG